MSLTDIQIDMRDIIDPVMEQLDVGNNVTISGEGRSMYPFIDPDKDRIVLMGLNGRKLRAGEIYLYKRSDGRYSVHRAYRVEKNGVSMLGDGQFTIEHGVPREAFCAVVCEVIKPGGRVDCLKRSNVCASVIKMRSRIFIHTVSSSLRRRIGSLLGK